MVYNQHQEYPFCIFSLNALVDAPKFVYNWLCSMLSHDLLPLVAILISEIHIHTIMVIRQCLKYNQATELCTYSFGFRCGIHRARIVWDIGFVTNRRRRMNWRDNSGSSLKFTFMNTSSKNHIPYIEILTGTLNSPNENEAWKVICMFYQKILYS